MKKILIIVTVTIAVLALTPIVGNKIIESKLDENINKLSQSGLEIKKQDGKSGYLNASKHYEFVVKDSKKLSKYLSEMSKQQIPTDTNGFFEDSVIGIDLEYSNVPVLKSTSIDIYPISLGKKTMQEIKKEDQKFAKYVEKFLSKKSLLYHVDYDLLSKDFEGYLKDIKESYDHKDGQKIEFELSGSTFYGNGNLLAPRFLRSKTKRVDVYLTDSKDEGKFVFENLLVSSSFQSITSYNSSLVIKSFEADIKNTNKKDSKIDVKDLNFGFASSTDGKKAKFYSKSSFEKFDLDVGYESVSIKNFNFDTELGGIDKDSYEELNTLLRSASNLNATSTNYKMQKLMQEMLLRGFILDLKDISVENVSLNNANDLGASSLKANIKLPENSIKTNTNPMELINKIDVDMLLNISKPMFELITKSNPIIAISRGYAKDQGNSLVYDIKIKDGSFTVNDKKVK